MKCRLKPLEFEFAKVGKIALDLGDMGDVSRLTGGNIGVSISRGSIPSFGRELNEGDYVVKQDDGWLEVLSSKEFAAKYDVVPSGRASRRKPLSLA